MNTARLTTPLQALQKTALFRILASDITSSVDATHSSSTLPHNATSVENQESRLQTNVLAQVLDIEDIGRSRWSQVESLEQLERGEMTKGREIIRLAPEPDDDDLATNQQNQQDLKSRGPHKLLLQDAKGVKIYAFELFPTDGIDLNMAIGTKLLLKNATLARGVVMLKPNSVEVLGGKIEAWDQVWRAGRKEALKQRVQTEDAD